MASGTWLLVASIALVSPFGDEPSSITSQKQVVSGGFAVDEKCRKLEEAFHSGNGAVETRGNKHISRVVLRKNSYVETTTFCAEL